MTYKKVQAAYEQRYGKSVKTCWIADIKREFDPAMKQAWNRQSNIPTNPCPDNVYANLKTIMSECGMI